MTAIRKSLLQLVFSGAYLLRWNDKLRPVELVELDKQAHKMLTACLLWQENSASLPCERRTAIARRIVEGGIADYLYRLIITDIKPPVFYRIKENPEHFRQLTTHVLKRLEPSVGPLGDFWLRLCQWHEQPPETAATPNDLLARRILAAAHMYASSWEFCLIRPVNTFDEEMEEIAASFRSRLDAFRDLAGMTAILDGTDALARVANLCGRLRFQIRWTQVPRIPATSVLGHMFLVAVYAYFFSLKIGACPARACNNFFCGLLHDLPELLTRDIIAPVKTSVPSLPDIIRQYEEEELQHRIFQPLRRDGYGTLADRLGYYLGMETGSEFHDAIMRNGHAEQVEDFFALHEHFNQDALDPKDGALIKVCDRLAAFMEAHSSIRNGVSASSMQEACIGLGKDLRSSPLSAVLGLEALLADFD